MTEVETMGKKKTPSIDHQIKQHFDSMMAIGESKQQAKKDEQTRGAITGGKIYSWKTRKTYDDGMRRFAGWVKETEGVKLVDDMRPFVGAYIDHLKETGASAWTQKRDLAAISKYFQHSYFQEVKTDKRVRQNIVRSRDVVENDCHFSKSNNEELINFCRHTGLRRRELAAITGSCLVEKEGQFYIKVFNGKGGKYREVMVLDNDPRVIERLKNTPPGEKIWPKVHSHADIHGYRSEYANELYKRLARDVSKLPKKEVYHCQLDKAGVWYDREAMRVVSNCLGHNRIDVIAESYLR